MPEPLKPFMAQLGDDYKGNEYIGEFDDWNGVVGKTLELREKNTSYEKEIEKLKTGNKNLVRIPDENSTEEELAAFREAIGVPGGPDDYPLETEEGKLDAFSDENFAGEFKKLAHKVSLTKEQGGELANFINLRELARQTSDDGQREKDRAELEQSLKAKHKENLPKKVAELRDFMLNFAPKTAKELLRKFNLDNNYEVTAVMMEFAERFAEGSTLRKGGSGGKEPPSQDGLTYEGMDDEE